MSVCTGGLSVFHDVCIVDAVVCKFPIRHREIGRIYPEHPPGPTLVYGRRYFPFSPSPPTTSVYVNVYICVLRACIEICFNKRRVLLFTRAFWFFNRYICIKGIPSGLTAIAPFCFFV